MTSMRQLRNRLVARQIEARGVRDPLVLAAMRAVPREKFVPKDRRIEAYEDTPLPIGAGQTISQPYIVAFMVEALALRGGERVLEIGAGSGYAAAVLAEIAREVFTIERIGRLAEMAAANLAAAGCDNVHVRHADGTEGWVEEAPFDAILVSAGAPDVPKSLTRQLKIGGRLVIPVGSNPRSQELIRITRVDEEEFEREDIADVRFVPLIGKEGWESEDSEWQTKPPRVVQARPAVSVSVPALIARHGEKFEALDDADLEPLLRRIGDARVVLIGEASHGTSEFYRLRERITRRLIEAKAFNLVAIEADWPDAARIDHYARHRKAQPSEWTAFARFPTWMWRNDETRAFVDWLHARNSSLDYRQRVAFYGLDLYSLYTSARAVIDYLATVDPELATIAKQRYGCLSPWEADPAAYGRAALRGTYHKCEQAVAHILVELLQKRQALFAARWRALLRCLPERTIGSECGTILPRHVLRLAGFLESPRHSYVRDVAERARSPRGRLEGGDLGAQLAYRRCLGYGDGPPRRAQYRPALPCALRQGVLCDRLRDERRNRGRGLGLGRADGGHAGPAGPPAKL